MCRMGKPIISTTFAGFPDMLVDRVIRLKKMTSTQSGVDTKQWARNHLHYSGISVVNFGDPYYKDQWNLDARDDPSIVKQMSEVLSGWA
jgi:hypothetical protein